MAALLDYLNLIEVPELIEVRLTPWRDVTNDPAWAKTAMAGYRIYVAKVGVLWFQRHEWQYRDGKIVPDNWIKSIPSFPPHAQPIEYSYERFIRETTH